MNYSPKTEDTDPKTDSLTSIFGDPWHGATGDAWIAYQAVSSCVQPMLLKCWFFALFRM